ncbi:MAG: hypothetical protein NC548_28905 [Lachnospiraceae bacterium]|nr:hypothetical protein [Lachnospiraceae bacterium]MCM1233736.1 hypothetical protein [Ruminococcus flavefaciens]
MTNQKNIPDSEEKIQDAILDLTSELYLLDKQDRQYLSQYYQSLVQDLYHVAFDTKEAMDSAYQILKKGEKVA